MAIASMEAGNGMNPVLPSLFYQTISHPSDHPIRISTLFMERHGESLGDDVILSSGETEWKVGLRFINGGTWFDEGWKEFVRFYSIKEDYLLAFDYEGYSRFLVTVFDKTANEIAYPVDLGVKIAPAKVEIESDSDSVPVRETGDAKPSLGRRLRKRISGRDSDGSSEGKSRFRINSNHEKHRVLAFERDFKSEFPFFVCSLKPSYVSRNYVACVPVGFLSSNFDANDIRRGFKFNVRLSGEKKMWPVVLKLWRHNGMMRGSGWRRFVEEKGPTVGEVCILELIKKDKAFNFYRCN